MLLLGFLQPLPRPLQLLAAQAVQHLLAHEHSAQLQQGEASQRERVAEKQALQPSRRFGDHGGAVVVL